MTICPSTIFVRLLGAATLLVLSSLVLQGCDLTQHAAASARDEGNYVAPRVDDGSGSCQKPGVCPEQGRSTQKSGFTDNTGWKDASSCCDICQDAKKVNCFDPAQCGKKTGDDDWDFLIFDQIWVPQLCASLAEGHDPTVTHPVSTLCSAKATNTAGMSIHGLWPSYYGGYPQCCRPPASLSPNDLPASLQQQAWQQWADPTFDSGDGCAFCSMWAHEFLKHGTCLTDTMAGYFEATLFLHALLKPQVSELEALLAGAGTNEIDVSAITDIFAPYDMQVVCDPKDPSATESVGVVLEIRTCWKAKPGFSRSNPDPELLEQFSCAKSEPSCPAKVIAKQGKAVSMTTMTAESSSETDKHDLMF
mmetsp:Transcript_87732/g.183395  ORF Transcript_87732/g.183395 Transcript_87732/m.183395 type:complete len:362 (-) Transcript_87732:98-1183(-)|eukprot:CAMPEP_0206425508 /NCGR_PEP_ID=MMETSP0324_2-20121206/3830_1 /ASSEMBLY_ACC=CAM_ASM_000836 /TAXON_ID=2866 /ORGANISM="Crypthecodinium cohnii, Strain Seligo" /LENGTH=361 /DNA_ID=CAMNT_0053890297 /DNA_START=162 /DNA_END=1247 /DNA_ORIENTATION=+